MGCSFSRETIKNAEEAAIIEAESSLEFHIIEAGDFDMNFSRFASGSVLSKTQLETAFNALKIEKSLLHEDPYLSYLSFFYDPNTSGYPLEKLVCIGILLGKGTPERKGELLLQNYDRDCSGEIDQKEFSKMIDDMIQISVSAAIDLAKKMDAGLTNDLDVYMKKLKKAQKIFSIYVQFIMTMGKDGKPITSDNFKRAFSDSKMKGLASTAGIREMIMELYKMQSPE